MTPDVEAQFIALWEAGASHVAIAAALAIPIGTVKNRAHTLQQQGQIQAQPRGGLVPVQRPVQPPDTGAEQSIDTDAGHSVDTGAVQVLKAEVEHINVQLRDLTRVVQSMLSAPVQTPMQITALPPIPQVKTCAGTCGFWMRSGRSSPRWPPSAGSPGASSSRSGSGRRSASDIDQRRLNRS